MKKTAMALAALVMALTVSAHEFWNFKYQKVSDPEQIPVCMIGDSITWADSGDYWRKYMLDQIPRLSFVGTHSSSLGYTHSGEGGNNTGGVLKRMANIPDCPYYIVHIGSNNNDIKKPEEMAPRAESTSKQVIQIAEELLKKKGVKKIFLCSIIPAARPTRDATNSQTNVLLREMVKKLPQDKVVWVELEPTLRAIPDWEKVIKLHPTKPGYVVMAKLVADAMIKELNIKDPGKTPKAEGVVGVRVYNLLDQKDQKTKMQVRCGNYVLSGTIVEAEEGAAIRLTNNRPPKLLFDKSFEVKGKPGDRVEFEFFTGNPSKVGNYPMTYELKNCKMKDLMLEKMRPTRKASKYTENVEIDTVSPVSLGEVWERP